MNGGASTSVDMIWFQSILWTQYHKSTIKWLTLNRVIMCCCVFLCVGVWHACSSCMLLGMETAGQFSCMYLPLSSSCSFASSSSKPLAMDSIKLCRGNSPITWKHEGTSNIVDVTQWWFNQFVLSAAVKFLSSKQFSIYGAPKGHGGNISGD